MSQPDSEGGQTITYQTNQQNVDLIEILEILNPIPPLTIEEGDNKEEIKLKEISWTVKKMQIHLNQLMEEESNDCTLEANAIHNLDVYSDRIPLNIKIALKPNINLLHIYMRI